MQFEQARNEEHGQLYELTENTETLNQAAYISFPILGIWTFLTFGIQLVGYLTTKNKRLHLLTIIFGVATAIMLILYILSQSIGKLGPGIIG